MNKLAQVFGNITPPIGLEPFTRLTGIPLLISILLRTMIVIAGIYAIFNFILAGYAFMSAGGDPKRIQDATAKIWQTIIGLIVTAGAFVIAAIIGMILYGSATALLQFRLFTP